MKEKRHIYTPIFVSAILLLMVITKLVDSSLLNRENEYVAIILLECVIFAIPGIIFTRLAGSREEKLIKISFLKKNSVMILLLASLILITGGILYGFLASGSDFGADLTFELYDVFTAKYADSVGEVMYLILAYALIPAFFEEFTFRGIICAKYDGISPLYSVLMSSVFFGFIHLDLSMLAFYIFAGFILSIVLYAVESVFITIAVHFIYNMFFIFCPMYISGIYVAGKEFLLFLCGIIFFGSLALFCSECRKAFLRKAEEADNREDSSKSTKPNFFEVILSPTAIACYVIYLVAVAIL